MKNNLKTVQGEKVGGFREFTGSDDFNLLILSAEDHRTNHAGDEFLREKAEEEFERQNYLARVEAAAGMTISLA